MTENKETLTNEQKAIPSIFRLKRWLYKPSWNRAGKVGYWMGIIPFGLLVNVNIILGIVGIGVQLLGCLILILKLDKKKKRTKLVGVDDYPVAQIKQIKKGKYETVGYLWLN